LVNPEGRKKPGQVLAAAGCACRPTNLLSIQEEKGKYLLTSVASVLVNRHEWVNSPCSL